MRRDTQPSSPDDFTDSRQKKGGPGETQVKRKTDVVVCRGKELFVQTDTFWDFLSFLKSVPIFDSFVSVSVSRKSSGNHTRPFLRPSPEGPSISCWARTDWGKERGPDKELEGGDGGGWRSFSRLRVEVRAGRPLGTAGEGEGGLYVGTRWKMVMSLRRNGLSASLYWPGADRLFFCKKISKRTTTTCVLRHTARTNCRQAQMHLETNRREEHRDCFFWVFS